MDEALALWESSRLAADVFGADVVSHYATMARVELEHTIGGDRLGAAPLLRAPMTVIGLTTYAEPATMLVWQREFAMLHASYVAATERAGGIAVLLPPQAAEAERAAAEEVLDRLDGLVLTGGADVDPQRYGEAPGERDVTAARAAGTSGGDRPGPRRA